MWKNSDQSLETAVFFYHPWTIIRKQVMDAKVHLTICTIDDAIHKYIAHFFQKDIQQRLLEELCNSELPLGIAVLTFQSVFSMFNDHVSLLPGDFQPLTEVEQRIAFFKAMPETWKTHWITISGSDNVSSVPLCDLQEFMSIQQYIHGKLV